MQVDVTANDLIALAQLKLPDCKGPLPIPEMSQDAILACLSARFGWGLTSLAPSTRRIENTQVKRHLRWCLEYTGSHRFVFLTVTASEPYLAQATAEPIQLCATLGGTSRPRLRQAGRTATCCAFYSGITHWEHSESHTLFNFSLVWGRTIYGRAERNTSTGPRSIFFHKIRFSLPTRLTRSIMYQVWEGFVDGLPRG
jgi:hypothetical protein